MCPQLFAARVLSALSQRSERIEHLLVVGLVPGVVEDFAVAHRAVLVDHERGTLGDALEADHVLVERPVGANDFFVEITEEWEVELLIGLKRLERKKSVNADAVDLGLRVVQLRDVVAERAQLLGADPAERRRKECEHDRMPPLRAERDGLPILVHQRKVRRFRSHFCRHEASIRAPADPSTYFPMVRIAFSVGL